MIDKYSSHCVHILYFHPVASQFGQSLLQLDSSQSTLNSQMQGQAKLLNEVSICSLLMQCLPLLYNATQTMQEGMAMLIIKMLNDGRNMILMPDVISDLLFV